MFSALREAVKAAPVYTPAVVWQESGRQNSIKRTTDCANALNADTAVFAAGDSSTFRLSDNEQVGPGGAIHLASQPELLAGVDKHSVWISGSVIAGREISAITGLAASRQVPGEFWLANDKGVSLINESLQDVGSVVTEFAVDACAAGGHPRVVYLGGETIMRADLRNSICQPLTSARPQPYYAGWSTDWDGTGVYNWSAVKVHPRVDFILGAVSQRYRSLVIFDLRKNCIPLAEWSLPTHPDDSGLLLRTLDWSPSGNNLLAFAARSRCIYSIAAAGSYAPLFSNMQVTQSSSMVLGACLPLNDSTMLVLSGDGNLATFSPMSDVAEDCYIPNRDTDEPQTDSIPCGELIRKLLDQI